MIRHIFHRRGIIVISPDSEGRITTVNPTGLLSPCLHRPPPAIIGNPSCAVTRLPHIATIIICVVYIRAKSSSPSLFRQIDRCAACARKKGNRACRQENETPTRKREREMFMFLLTKTTFVQVTQKSSASPSLPRPAPSNK